MRAVLVKSTGGAGLGDSIRALLSGLHYAMMAKRALCVRWDDGLYNGVRGEDVFSSLLDIVDFPTVSFQKLNSADVYPPAWLHNLETPLNTLYGRLRNDDWNRAWAIKNLSFDQTRFDYAQPVLVMWDFDQFFMSWNGLDETHRVGKSAEAALRILASKHLRLSASLKVLMHDFKQAYFSDSMIGVHVRKTNEQSAESKLANQSDYFRAIEAIRSRVPNAGIFLATDNMEMEAVMKKRYPFLVNRPKWFPAAGAPIHLTGGGPDKLQRTQDALVEMFLLASCDHLIYPALSSFSQAARYLSGLPDERVTALRKVVGFRKWWHPLKRFLTSS